VYIVSRPEREEFLQLRNDQDCQEFIEGFWQRRPAAFKEEHYRRIAYANERFPSGVPGWRTDRGRIYITYGPPEEIESHPSGSNARTYPFEIWRYTSIKGVGDDVWIEFVDTKQDGDYRMLTMRDAAALALLRRQPEPGPGEPTPRVSMMLVDPRVYVDGKDFGRVGLQAVSGYTLYVAVKGLGRFVLSLDRHHDVGLTEIGSTSGRRVEVEVGGHTMRIDCAADVSSAGPITVFGRLDSSYQPEGELEFSATGITSK
jgi:GWxTD domain-containing protein